MGTTDNPHDGCLHDIDPDTGMQRCYLVLPDGSRKNLVRPLRTTYIHVGSRPTYPIRALTDEERERYSRFGYVAYEKYPDDKGTQVTGRYWTQSELQSGCGATTRMAVAIAETYAAQPRFYGATMCVKCRAHFPVGPQGEFVWEDGTRVGT